MSQNVDGEYRSMTRSYAEVAAYFVVVWSIIIGVLAYPLVKNPGTKHVTYVPRVPHVAEGVPSVQSWTSGSSPNVAAGTVVMSWQPLWDGLDVYSSSDGELLVHVDLRTGSADVDEQRVNEAAEEFWWTFARIASENDPCR